MAQKILLGKGVFYIGEVPVGLTRGGGQFTIEKEYRPIQADGDRGNVKGRIVQDTATPKLVVNTLEVITENLPKMYPAVKATVEELTTKVTGKGKIEDTDYQDYVKWVGETKNGREVIIKVFNAINLENLDWSLVDKDEAVATLTYTGCYLEESLPNYEPWEIEYTN